MIVHEVNGVQVNQRPQDGYINATEVCKANNKEWRYYWRSSNTKKYVKALAEDLGLNIIVNNPTCSNYTSALVVAFRGGNSQQSTWVHPEVAIDLAQWISIPFRIKVNRWIVQWMTASRNTIQPQVTEKEVDPEVAAVLAELEKLIISIRSHGRIMHIGSHQPVDELLFKSLHTLNHNQMFAINAAIKQLEMLKRFGSMNITEDVTLVSKAVAVNFSNFDNAANVASLSPATEIQPEPSNSEQQKTATRTTARKENTQLTGINIKIPLSQRQWLANTARQVRQNSAQPVPPSARVYPQHLVGIAIDLLQNSDLDSSAAHSDRLEQNEVSATINIKISRYQHQWLSDRAKDLRDCQPQTTTPNQRIYPQHLISMAITLLQGLDINWQRVDSVTEIEQKFATA
jgi:hypothetical protein